MAKPTVKQRSAHKTRPAAIASRAKAKPAAGGSFRLTYATMFDPPPHLHEKFEKALAGVKGSLGREHPMWIGGKERAAAERFEDRSSINTNWILGAFAKGAAQDATDALAAARAAFPAWSRMRWQERVRLLRKVVALIEKRVYEISAALALEVGKNRMEALGDVQEAADLIAYLHRSRDELDRMKQQMAAEMRALEDERRKLRTEWTERQRRRIEELEQKFAEMQKRMEQEVSRIVEGMKERELRAQMEKQARRKVAAARSEAREEMNAAVVQTLSESQADLGTVAPVEPVSAERLVPGVRVRVRGFPQAVVLRRVDGSTAEVEAGPLRMKLSLDEITGIEGERAAAKAAATPANRSVTVHAEPGEGAIADEINVIGLTVEEATSRVDKFLDEAALANKLRVRIIHGHGTGALRRGLGEFLAGHPLVAGSAFESEEHGGKAITIVDLQS